MREDVQRSGSPAAGRGQRGLRSLRNAWAAALALLVACAGDPGIVRTPAEGTQAPRFSLLALGDTGRLAPLGRAFQRQLAVGRGLASEDARAASDALLLLGDNFYWDGLVEAELVARLRANLVRPYCRFVALDGPRSAEVASACDRPTAARHPIPIHAVLGNHDYRDPASPRLQRREVPRFVPNWHVPEGLVEVVEFPAGVSLLLLDSVALRRGADPASLVTALRRSRGPWRILAAHHPVASARDAVGGGPGGDAGYRATLQAAIEAAGVPLQLALAGHEHNLQLVETPGPGPRLVVVVGSGSRVRATRTTNPSARFVRAAAGFARLDLLGTGAGEELAVTVFETPSAGALALGAPRARAAVRIARDGTLREWQLP